MDTEAGAVAEAPEQRETLHIATRGIQQRKVVLALLWIGALSILILLLLQRYKAAIGTHPLSGGNNFDFRTFFHGAELTAEGRSPYSSADQYIYFAPIALLISPFVHSNPLNVLKSWTVIQLLAFSTSVGVMANALKSRLASAWQLPAFVALCAVTGLHLWPTTYELFLSNDDLIVLLLLVASAVAWMTNRPGWFGVFVGISCIIKVWPVLIMIALFQTGTSARKRILSAGALVAMVIIGLLTNFIPAGTREFDSFFRAVFAARSKQLVSDSIGGIPRLLFSKSGLAKPLVVSSDLRYLLMAGLGVWTVGLLLVSIRTRTEPMLCVFQICLFVILVIPVSHMCYSIYELPIVWYWIANYHVFIEKRRRDSWHTVLKVVLAVVLITWYIVQIKAWPGDGSSASISAVKYSYVFAANLCLYSASALGGWLLLPKQKEPSRVRSSSDLSVP